MTFYRTVLALLILLGGSGLSVQKNDAVSERININVSPSGQRHPLTLQEIVSLREIAGLQISPDGRLIAFLVKQAFIDTNGYRMALYVVKTDGASPPTKLAEEAAISEPQWSPDSRWILYISSKSGSSQIWRVAPSGGDPEQVSRHRGGLRGYKWIRPSVAVWLMDVSGGQEKSIGEPSVSSLPAILQLAWSPDGRYLAVEYKPSNEPEQMFNNSDIGLLDLQTNQFRPVVEWPGADTNIAWASDSKSFAFVSQGNIDTRERFYEFNVSVFRYSLTSGIANQVGDLQKGTLLSGLWRSAHEGLLYSVRGGVGNLYELPLTDAGRGRKITDTADYLSGCSPDDARTIAACIIENPTTPPEIATVDLRTGHLKRLTSLNPEYANIELSEVSDLKWTNRYGTETNGFLIKPLGYESGKRYPLAVILYGFEWKFTSQAQWISSYPAQVFASRGIAVLLMNFPREGGWRYGDYKRAAFSQGYSPMASIESAVDMLVKMGTVDPNRKAILGWSFGSFLTEFAITHSRLFQAASAGEGGLNNPGQYWLLGDAAMRHYLEGFFGGPPYGETYKNYKEFSPALNADKVETPILREYGPEVGFQSFEFYTALRRFGKPVEQVFYPRETHIFSQPRHRINSMRRNIDWLDFWLKGEEDPDPAKREQYTRWRVMRGTLKRTPPLLFCREP